MFDRVQHQLAPADHLSLDTPLQVARHDQTADQWIANQTGTDGPPLQERVAADPDLPLDTKRIIRAKVDARDSAAGEQARRHRAGLDDQVAGVTRTLPTTPGAYKPGTFARLADAYAAAGELGQGRGGPPRREWEAFMLPFAQASAERQQRMIDELSRGRAARRRHRHPAPAGRRGRTRPGPGSLTRSSRPQHCPGCGGQARYRWTHPPYQTQEHLQVEAPEGDVEHWAFR